ERSLNRDRALARPSPIARAFLLSGDTPRTMGLSAVRARLHIRTGERAQRYPPVVGFCGVTTGRVGRSSTLGPGRTLSSAPLSERPITSRRRPISTFSRLHRGRFGHLARLRARCYPSPPFVSERDPVRSVRLGSGESERSLRLGLETDRADERVAEGWSLRPARGCPRV